MKKFGLLLLILSLLLLTCACSNTLTTEPSNAIKIPFSSSSLCGTNYQEVIEKLTAAGFTNIKTELIYDIVVGWFTADGEVDSVAINGDTSFSTGDYFAKDAEIIVTYHTWASDKPSENINSSVPDGYAAVPSSSNKYVGQNYLDVMTELENAGFTNIRTEILYDIITGWLTSDGDVASVSINGQTTFGQWETFSIDSEIIITYHTWEKNDPCKISITINASDFIGMHKPDAEANLREMGFTDFEYNAVTTNDQSKDNTIISIEVVDWLFTYDNFKIGDIFDSDVSVRLSYYAYVEPECNFHSSKNYQQASQGLSGVYAYVKSGSYDVYWIIDLDAGYAYNFTEGNGNDCCDKIRLTSGNFNDKLKLKLNIYSDNTYATYYLRFLNENDPSSLIFIDHMDFNYEFTCTNLDAALILLDSIFMNDMSAPIAPSYDSSGLAYLINYNRTCTIIDVGNNTDSNLVIPEKIGNYTVTNIGEDAFSNCNHLTSVSLPESLIYIADFAFYDCENLESINIPANVIYLGATSFSGCESLKHISLPNKITEINPSTFSGCTSLERIELPNSLIKIEACAFEGCSSLSEISISSDVVMIGVGAFSGCINLTTVNIPKSVIRIDAYAFYGCEKLESINYGGKVSEWNSIQLGIDWDFDTDDYTIYCQDGKR